MEQSRDPVGPSSAHADGIESQADLLVDVDAVPRPAPRPRSLRVSLLVLGLVVVLVVAGAITWSATRNRGLAGPGSLADLSAAPTVAWEADLIDDQSSDLVVNGVWPVDANHLLASVSYSSSTYVATGSDGAGVETWIDAQTGALIDPPSGPAPGGLFLLDASTGDPVWSLPWSDLGVTVGDLTVVSGADGGNLMVTRLYDDGGVTVDLSVVSVRTGAVVRSTTIPGAVPAVGPWGLRPPLGPDEEAMLFRDMFSGMGVTIQVDSPDVPVPALVYTSADGLDCQVDAYAASDLDRPVWTADYPNCEPLTRVGGLVQGTGYTGVGVVPTTTSIREVANGAVPVWFNPSNKASVSVVPIGDGVLVGGARQSGKMPVQKLDDSGRVRWKAELDAMPVPAGDGLVVEVGNSGAGTLSRVDPATGQVLWTVDQGADVVWPYEQWVVTDEAVVVPVSTGESATVLDSATGAVRAVIPASVGWSGRHVIYGIDGHDVAAWSAEGNRLWGISLDDYGTPQPVPGRFITAQHSSGRIVAWR